MPLLSRCRPFGHHLQRLRLKTRRDHTATPSGGTFAGIEYLGANLDAIYHAEGRCTPNGATAFHYEYTLKDHLGNARVNFRANGVAVVFIEDMHYYPFGMQMEGIGVQNPANKYLYNGKERNEDLGLNLSDYGARWYDAAVGRWWSVDPLASGTVNISTYAYVLNNPIILIDPTGMESKFYDNGNMDLEGSDAQNYFRGLQKAYEKQKGNNIYVLALSGADKDVMKGLETTLGQFIKDATLTTNIVMVNDAENFDITKIQVTDAVAVVGGDKKETVEFIMKHLDKGYIGNKFREELNGEFLSTPSWDILEKSDAGNSGWGYLIATSTKQYDYHIIDRKMIDVAKHFNFLNMTDAVAFSILHGMGHNSGITHSVNGRDGGFMTSKVADFMDYHKGNVSALIKETVSDHPSVITTIKNRFKPINNP